VIAVLIEESSPTLIADDVASDLESLTVPVE
jgi:hypothetical protein